MRLFVGVEPGDPLRAACAKAAEDLRSQLQKGRVDLPVRWIPEDNLHVTLWFIGEVRDEIAATIADALRRKWSVAPFPMAVEGAGVFPPAGRARILWLGVTQGANDLAELYRELGVRLGPAGASAESRSYHPHITVGRIKEASTAASRKARSVLSAARVRAGSTEIRFVTLFQSRHSPSGARYEPLLRVPLE